MVVPTVCYVPRMELNYAWGYQSLKLDKWIVDYLSELKHHPNIILRLNNNSSLRLSFAKYGMLIDPEYAPPPPFKSPVDKCRLFCRCIDVPQRGNTIEQSTDTLHEGLYLCTYAQDVLLLSVLLQWQFAMQVILGDIYLYR